MNRCESCGREVQDKKYCSSCANEDGSLKQFEQVAQSLADELVCSQGLHGKAALEVAKSILPKHPAWEHVEVKVIKTKKRWNLVLSILTIVMLILSSGLFYFIGQKNRNSNELEQAESAIFTPIEISPFDNIKEEIIDSETVVYEMICQGDQRLNNLDGSYITFRSLQGSENSKSWKMYNFDIYSTQGHVFNPGSQETITFLASMGQPLIYSEENQPICEPKWIYDTKTGKFEQFQESALGHRIGNYYVYEKFYGNPFGEDYKGSSIAYLNLSNNVTLEATPTDSKKISYHMMNYYSNDKIIYYIDDSDQFLYGFDIEKKRTFKTSVKDTQLTCRGASNDRFVTFIAGWDGLFAFDTLTNKYFKLSDGFTNNQMLTNPKKKKRP